MSDISGYEAEPTDVQALVDGLLAALADETDPLVRYTRLCSEQALYAALVGEIAKLRGRELLAMSKTASYEQVAEMTGLGNRQRVGQLIKNAR